MPEEEQKELVEQEPQLQQELFSKDEFLQLERLRIDSVNKRTDVAQAYIDANSAADQRRYNYHVQKMESDREERSETRKATTKILWAFLGASSFFTLILFYMLFLGNPEQVENAGALLKVLGTGVGGLGIGYLLLRVISRLTGKL